MTKIKMRLRQTFDDKTEEIQARDDSPAWISRYVHVVQERAEGPKAPNPLPFGQ